MVFPNYIVSKVDMHNMYVMLTERLTKHSSNKFAEMANTLVWPPIDPLSSGAWQHA